MKFEIKNRWSGEVMFSCELAASFDNESYSIQLGAAVKAAVKARANLADANLADADLAGAYLADAYLARANLARANLARANLARADLADANLAGANLARANLARADLARANLAGADLADADLADANLTDAYLARANLADADLADADLADANLTDAKNLPVEPATPEQAVANLDKVREIILENAERLRMNHWHGDEGWQERTCAEEAVCGTTHCLAGWLQVCATDDRVRKLPASLAGYIQAPVAASMFFETDKRAFQWLSAREYAA